MRKIIALILTMVSLVCLSCCGKMETPHSEDESEAPILSYFDKTQSASKEDNSIESAESEEEEETSSSLRRPVVRPGQTVSESESIRVNVPVDKAMGVGAYHFSPKHTDNYGNTKSSRYEEFEDVLKAGYFNTVILPLSNFSDSKVWEICEKYEMTVWLDIGEPFDSKKQTLSEYIKPISKKVKSISNYDERWQYFSGFFFDECVNRGQKNADFLAVTKELYKLFGKRNLAVFVLSEFDSIKNDEDFTQKEADKIKSMHPDSFKYLTDVSFKSFGVDVRINAPLVSDDKLAEPVKGKVYYTAYTELLKSVVGHKVNMWFVPTTFSCPLVTSANELTVAEELFCLGHVNFFDSLLKDEKHRGGLLLYSYSQFGEEDFGLQSRLVVLTSWGRVKLRYGEDKWYRFSKRLTDLTEEYRTLEGDIITEL